MTDILRQIILPRLDGVRPSSGSFMARCPAHDDGTASLSISRGTTQPVIFKCHAGCDTEDILTASQLSWADISNPGDPLSGLDRRDRQDTWMPCGHTKVAEYPYDEANGQLAFAVARCDKKGHGCQGFRQWRPDQSSRSGKKWSLKLPDGSKVGEGLPYRLPRILADTAKTIYVVEGEKDVDRLWNDYEFLATCNAGGAGKWTVGHAAWLTGFTVLIIADRDGAGRKHALRVADTLKNIADAIDIAQADRGKDLSDHLDAGGTPFDLELVARLKQPPRVLA